MGRELLLAWLFVASYMLASGIGVDQVDSPGFQFAFQVGFVTCITTWVLKDATRRKLRPCYDYDTFVFYAWMLLVPIYLFQTRSLKALATLGWFALLAASAACVGALGGLLLKLSE